MRLVIALGVGAGAKIVKDGLWTGFDFSETDFAISNGNIEFPSGTSNSDMSRRVEAARMVPYSLVQNTDFTA